MTRAISILSIVGLCACASAAGEPSETPASASSAEAAPSASSSAAPASSSEASSSTSTTTAESASPAASSTAAAVDPVGPPPLEVDHLSVDLSDGRAAEQAVRTLAERAGGLAGVVTAAGIDACGRLEDVPAGLWERVVQVNLLGTVAVVRAALPFVRHADGQVWPTAVEAARMGEQVVISCVLTDIVFRWTLSPDPGGCCVRLDVAIPEREASRLGMQETAMRDAIVRLARAAEHAAA